MNTLRRSSRAKARADTEGPAPPGGSQGTSWLLYARPIDEAVQVDDPEGRGREGLEHCSCYCGLRITFKGSSGSDRASLSAGD
jgi:hypothetical protein